MAQSTLLDVVCMLSVWLKFGRIQKDFVFKKTFGNTIENIFKDCTLRSHQFWIRVQMELSKGYQCQVQVVWGSKAKPYTGSPYDTYLWCIRWYHCHLCGGFWIVPDR